MGWNDRYIDIIRGSRKKPEKIIEAPEDIVVKPPKKVDTKPDVKPDEEK